MNKQKVTTMTIAALLCAVGIIIPMFAPKILIPPASYTLGSHVPIFIAMFLSPTVAITVSLVTTIGFFISGFPLIIVTRALTHVIFASVGAYILKKNKHVFKNMGTTFLYSFLISLLHAIGEVIAVTFFYTGGEISAMYKEVGYLVSVVGLVGVGSLVHSMLDFSLAVIVWKPLQNIISVPSNVRLKAKVSKS